MDAQVRRVLTFGGSIRVELDAVGDGLPAGASGHYEVILSRERALSLSQGQRVRLIPEPLRLFRAESPP